MSLLHVFCRGAPLLRPVNVSIGLARAKPEDAALCWSDKSIPACVPALIATRQQEVRNQVVRVGVSRFLANVARGSEMEAAQNAGFFHFMDCL